MKGFARELVLKQRYKITRKWLMCKPALNECGCYALALGMTSTRERVGCKLSCLTMGSDYSRLSEVHFISLMPKNRDSTAFVNFFNPVLFPFIIYLAYIEYYTLDTLFSIYIILCERKCRVYQVDKSKISSLLLNHSCKRHHIFN